MKLLKVGVALLLALVVAGTAVAQMKQGTARGKVVTVGEDRVVVQVNDGGQMTFEVAKVKVGNEMVKDRAQMAQIKTLQQDQTVEVKWGQDHTGHYYIVELTAGPADQARQGIVQGKVITANEGRVVIALDEGGQMTLEPNWIRRGGKYMRDPFHELFGRGLRAGDEVVAMWELDEGTHYITRGISKTDPTGQALALVLMQAQLTEAQRQINQLQDQIRNLQNLLNRALHGARD